MSDFFSKFLKVMFYSFSHAGLCCFFFTFYKRLPLYNNLLPMNVGRICIYEKSILWLYDIVWQKRFRKCN